MSKALAVSALVGIALLLGAVGAAGEDLSQWRYSQRVALNTTASGADVATDVSNFPLLIRLDHTNFVFANAAENGRDLRFLDSDGTFLAYEVEVWEPDQGVAAVWVLIPQVEGSSTQDHITMYWGKNDAVDVTSQGVVFSPDNGFAAVWHLHDGAPGVGTVGAYADASGSGHNGDDYVADEQKEGLIGRGQHFNKVALDRVIAPGSDGDVVEFTLSAWVYADAVRMDWDDSDGDLRQKWVVGNFQWWPTAGFGMQFLGTQLIALVATEGDHWFYHPGALTAHRWTHVAVARSADGVLRMFADGQQVAEFTTPPGAFRAGDGQVVISSPEERMGFDGKIDEVRESMVARSPEWIKLCYENQRADQRLVVLAPNDIVLQAGTSADGLDGARVHLRAGGNYAESGAVEIMPGQTTEHSQQVVASVNIGTPEAPAPMRASTIGGFSTEQDGANLVLSGGDGLNAGGRITLEGGNAETLQDPGAGNIVMMPGGTGPLSEATAGAVVVGTPDQNRSLRVNGSIDFSGTLSHGGVAFSPSQWQQTSAGIGYPGAVAVGGLVPENYMLAVDGPAYVNGEILSAVAQSHYLVYTQSAARNNGVYWDDTHKDLELWTNSTRRLSLKSDGRVGIGTDDPGLYLLAVEGSVGCRELVVTVDQWADDVFDGAYALPEIEAVKAHIAAHKRLPGVPSEEEVAKDGLSVGKMHSILLRKVEELTLYMISLKEQNQRMKQELDVLREEVAHERATQR